MKKLVAMLLIIAIVCTLAFALTACDGSSSDPLDETIDPTQSGSKIDVPGPEDPDASKDADGAYIHSK